MGCDLMAMTMCSRSGGKSGKTNQSFINVLLKNLPSLVPSSSDLIQGLNCNCAVSVPVLLCTLPPKWGSNRPIKVWVSNHPSCPLLPSSSNCPHGQWVTAWSKAAVKEKNKTGRGKVLAHLSYFLGSASWVPAFDRVLNISWESRTF